MQSAERKAPKSLGYKLAVAFIIAGVSPINFAIFVLTANKVEGMTVVCVLWFFVSLGALIWGAVTSTGSPRDGMPEARD